MDSTNTMDVAEVAAFLRAEPETVAQYARSGELAGTRIGKGWIFLREDVLAFLRRRITSETEARRAAYAQAKADGRAQKPEPATKAQNILVERKSRTRRTQLPTLPAILVDVSGESP